MITEAQLYDMGQESPTAYYAMPDLCKAAGLPFPPKKPTPNTAAREALPDPLLN